MHKRSALFAPLRQSVIALMVVILSGCYHYRVLNTNNDPSTEYQKRVLWSYFWGMVNKPKAFVVPNCTDSNAIDEVQSSTNFGYAVLTVATLGIVCPMEVKWKCHKPCQRVTPGL